MKEELFYDIDTKIFTNKGFVSPRQLLDENQYTFIHTDLKTSDRVMYPVADGYLLNGLRIISVHCRVVNSKLYYNLLTCDLDSSKIVFEDTKVEKISLRV